MRIRLEEVGYKSLIVGTGRPNPVYHRVNGEFYAPNKKTIHDKEDFILTLLID